MRKCILLTVVAFLLAFALGKEVRAQEHCSGVFFGDRQVCINLGHIDLGTNWIVKNKVWYVQTQDATEHVLLYAGFVKTEFVDQSFKDYIEYVSRVGWSLNSGLVFDPVEIAQEVRDMNRTVQAYVRTGYVNNSGRKQFAFMRFNLGPSPQNPSGITMYGFIISGDSSGKPETVRAYFQKFFSGIRVTALPAVLSVR